MATSPYDSLTSVLYAVRARIGDDIDTLLPLGGQLASNGQYYSQQIVNNAWRKLQQFLVSNKYVRLVVPNFVIPSLPPVNSEDAAIQVSLSWSGYNDGVAPFPAFVLPQDLIRPLKLAERPSDDAPNLNAFIDMDGPEQGISRIPLIPKQQWNGLWVWDTDQITMPGALALTDLSVTYAAYLPDFLDTGDVTTATGFTPWFEHPVPIMRALDPLANYILAEIERARLNMPAVLAYTTDAENGALTGIIQRSTGALQ